MAPPGSGRCPDFSEALVVRKARWLRYCLKRQLTLLYLLAHSPAAATKALPVEFRPPSFLSARPPCGAVCDSRVSSLCGKQIGARARDAGSRAPILDHLQRAV